jgi:hypothetical protein
MLQPQVFPQRPGSSGSSLLASSCAEDVPLSLAPWSLGKTEVWDAMKYFSTLSGSTQHIESGACVGQIVMLRKAVEHVERKLRRQDGGG